MSAKVLAFRRCSLRALPALAFHAALVLSAGASGFRVPDQDAFATARGEAFAATADNASAIYYNPAGISQLEGHQIRGGVYGLNVQAHYTSPSGDEFLNEEKYQAVPQLFYTCTPESFPISGGLGIYAPYGLSSEWPENTGFRTVAIRGSVTYLTINPVIAWEILPNLSIAAGPTINYVNVELQSGFLSPAPGFGDTFTVKSQGWTAGFNAGILWKPIPQVQLGLSYRSPTTVRLKGDVDYKSPVFNARYDASAHFDFPQNIIAGISFRPTPEWNLEFDIDWTGWNRLNSVEIHQDVPKGSTVPEIVTIPFNWQSSIYYEFGVTRYFGKHWSLSCGYIFNQNSVPAADYQPLVFDQDRHFWSAGFGFRGTHFDVDLAYQFGYGPPRDIQNSTPSALGQSADGTYTFFSHALLLTLGWRF
jgi:long-chain fatty acid transport protein